MFQSNLAMSINSSVINFRNTRVFDDRLLRAECLVRPHAIIAFSMYVYIYEGVSKSFRTGRLEREL